MVSLESQARNGTQNRGFTEAEPGLMTRRNAGRLLRLS
jgi:hypothetical protein